MNLNDFRKQYPAYDTWSDDDLAKGLYNKFYKDKLSFDNFSTQVGYKPTIQDRTISQVGGDLVTSFGVGANQLLKMAGDLYGLTLGDMDNLASQQGQSGIEFWNQKKSPQLIELEQSRKQKIDAKEGQFAKAGTAFWETISSPTLLTSFLAEQVPMLLPVGAVGRTAGAATKTLGYGEKAVAGVATGAAVSTAGVMQGADAGSQAYEQLMAIPDEVWETNDRFIQLTKDGYPSGDAKREIATSLSRNAAIASGVISVGTNLLPGARILEKSLAGVKMPGGRISNAIRGFFGETVQEGLEEGGGALSANLATQIIDPLQSTIEGVGEATGLGAAAGPFGAVAGVVSTSDDRTQARRSITEKEQIAATVLNQPSIEAAAATANEIVQSAGKVPQYPGGIDFTAKAVEGEIGRASCRERV